MICAIILYYCCEEFSCFNFGGSSNSIDGWDSILSILQMPNGIPVATVALNGAKNAGILSASIIGAFDEDVAKNIERYKNDMVKAVLIKAKNVEENNS